MGTVKVIVKSIREKDLYILKEKLEKDFGVVWFEGPYPNREGGYKCFMTFETRENNERREG